MGLRDHVFRRAGFIIEPVDDENPDLVVRMDAECVPLELDKSGSQWLEFKLDEVNVVQLRDSLTAWLIEARRRGKRATNA